MDDSVTSPVLETEMCRDKNKTRRRLIDLLVRLTISTLFVYAGLYSLLMVHGEDVYEPVNWTVVSTDAYRFGWRVRIADSFAVYGPVSCAANHIFRPMEWLRTSVRSERDNTDAYSESNPEELTVP